MGDFTTTINYTRAVRSCLTYDATNLASPCNAELAAAQVGIPMEVKDARGLEARGACFSLERHGFQLVKNVASKVPTSSYANDDMALIEDVHHKEVAACVQHALPGAVVVPFNSLVRSSSPGAHDAPAGAAHCDYTVHTAVQLFDRIARPGQRKGRFIVLNAWRNVADAPIQNHHLAVCDARSVTAPDDFVHLDLIKPDDTLHTYRMDPTHRNTPGHRWWYFPAMTRSEVLLFMQYDSLATAQARYCFHTAVVDPRAPSAHRTSCETRMVAFFPEHTPCTIPEIVLKGSERVGLAMQKMVEALNYPTHWPEEARKWMARGVWRVGADKTLRQWVAFATPKNEFGLGDMSNEEREQLVRGLLDSKKFEDNAKRNFPEPPQKDSQCASS